MATAIREYDLSTDDQGRLTLQSAYTDWHATEFDDGTILLEPRGIHVPEMISARALVHMDEAVRRIREGNVGEAFDLNEVNDLISED